MHGAAPEYLTEMFTSVTDDPDRRHLRSTARGHIVVPRTNIDVKDVQIKI